MWLGSSLRDIVEFPEGARRAAGHNLGLVQNGLTPADWKPMEGIGPGTCHDIALGKARYREMLAERREVRKPARR